MVGAVRGIDPTTGHYFDDTKRYVDALDISDAERHAIFEGNARRVFPRLDSFLKEKGQIAPTEKQNIHEYLAEFDDIPGTRVFTAARARKGYWLNQFAMSLMTPETDAWKADERKYLESWPMTDDQKEAILARDYNRCLDLGGNVYFLAKVFSTDGLSFAEAVSSMTDMTFPEYRDMMNKGGRRRKATARSRPTRRRRRRGQQGR